MGIPLQGAEIESWVARASAANIARASLPFLHDDAAPRPPPAAAPLGAIQEQGGDSHKSDDSFVSCSDESPADTPLLSHGQQPAAAAAAPKQQQGKQRQSCEEGEDQAGQEQTSPNVQTGGCPATCTSCCLNRSRLWFLVDNAAVRWLRFRLAGVVCCASRGPKRAT